MNLDELRKYAGFVAELKNFDPSNKFDVWNVEKKQLHARENFPRPKRRQVWWFSIGQNVGQEQSCADGFGRPVLVVAVFGNIFWGLPITSSDPDGKKARSPLYIKLDGMKYLDELFVEKTLHGFIALRHLKSFDSRRLVRKLTRLDNATFDSIINTLKMTF
jgi:mRNA-degrading endonuclease toxin of MazEF toxin-antitoxin module